MKLTQVAIFLRSPVLLKTPADKQLDAELVDQLIAALAKVTKG